jgi:hypothetical protein
VLCALEDVLDGLLAAGAGELQDDLLGGLGLLVEDRLGLTTITTLLTVVTALTLGEEASLTGLVLSDLELFVLEAGGVAAVHLLLLGELDHCFFDEKFFFRGEKTFCVCDCENTLFFVITQ